ncbi:MAG TPA: FhaA domain-containing protein [Candidatus Limnocylindria bacterium]|nr:FhaA domain-containing protein [Candidatus Limnocylindria bacterium]
MAGPLAAIERFFERLLERPAARLFQARLEPVQIQRQLERAMEAERRLGSRRTYVPSSYRVILHPADLQAFESYRESMSADLADALHVHARNRGYTLTERPRVQLDASPRVAAGDVVVQAQPVDPPSKPPTQEPADGAPEPGQAVPAPDVAPRTAGRWSAEVNRVAGAQPAVAGPQPAVAGAQPAVAGAQPAASGPPPGRPDTSVYAASRPSLPNAVLAVRVPGQQVERLPVSSGTLRVGRALDNDIVLADDRVSRHHGQFGVRFGTLVYSDLGSTNGSYLNGSAVTEIALGPGDVLQLGSSTLAIEQGD